MKLLALTAAILFLVPPLAKAEPEFTAGNKSALRSTELAPGIFDLFIKLPRNLEPRRSEFRKDVIAAQKNIQSFASRSDWTDLLKEPLVKSVEVFATKDEFDKYIRSQSPEMKEQAIPKTFSAAADGGVLVAVTPEIFNANSPNDREPRAYEKLLTHELAHRLHAKVVGGDEEKMGPIWFFEGFAVHVANQYEAKLPALNDEGIWAIVNATERGSYPKYRVVFEHFLKDTTIKDYVQHAGEPGFTNWLRER